MQTSLLKLLRPLFVLLLLIPAGCAKSPAGGGTSPVSGPQLIVTMTVAGTINPSYYYYVLFNVNNTPGPNNSSVTGPVPVVAAPFGNGFAAGAFTNYVEYHTGLSPSNFYLYSITPNLLTPIPIGQGQLISPSLSPDMTTLTFQLPLAYLATSGVSADNINSLEVNFVATNVVPVATDSTIAKYFDALYPPQQAGNSYVTLIVRDANPTVLGQTFTNTGSGVNEGPGDVAQYISGMPVTVGGTTPDGVVTSDLDITNWTIQLTSGS